MAGRAYILASSTSNSKKCPGKLYLVSISVCLFLYLLCLPLPLHLYPCLSTCLCLHLSPSLSLSLSLSLSISISISTSPCIYLYLPVSPGKEEGVIIMNQKFRVSLKGRVCQKRLSYTVVKKQPPNLRDLFVYLFI